MTRRTRAIAYLFASLGAAILCLALYLFVGFSRVHPDTAYGITWSDPYAAQLGLDPETGLQATLDELGVRRFRIPAYWSEIEPAKGIFDFSRLDREMNAIAAKNGKVLLVVGATAPRWPECWVPMWAGHLPQSDRERAQLAYIQAVMNRYDRHPALEGWQIENEPTLIVFGQCKNQRMEFLREELLYAKQLTDKPVNTTDSGELSSWTSFPGLTDRRGVSVYRVVLISWFGVWRYPIPPFFYERKAALVEWLVGKVFISEFQMEPWGLMPLTVIPVDDQFKTFDLQQMHSNFDYATRIGLSPNYFWGAEWWYWMKEKRGHPEFWEEAKAFFGSHP